ncbi:MAG: phosphodiester glycosidase family protein [Actinomycetota bacterium]|nr:phosphodiester glycosidase family protein [Actinomycetota bacterium]
MQTVRVRGAHAAPTWWERHRAATRARRAWRRERRLGRRTWFGRHPKTIASLVVFLALTPVWVSLGDSMASANTLPLPVQFVEWVRSHGGGGFVRWTESIWYAHHPPPKGGRPAPGAIPAPVQSTTTTAPSVPQLPPPPDIVPLASPPLPGEGQWHPIGRTVEGQPAMYAAYLRPDPVHTSLVAGVVWMDPLLLRAQLYAGAQTPGTPGNWSPMAPISATAAQTLTAAFNAGFRMNASLGGFYLDGKTAVPLRNGAASFVVYANGTATVGAWGTNVTMTPQVVAVRQNLSLLVNNGAPVPGLNANDTTVWGATLGNQIYVWRSGLGVTADGALVYVGGPGLNITTLANLLVRAGAVRAMEFDINTDWVNFFSFSPPAGQAASPANGTKLLSDMVRPVSRYFGPTNRDFITMSVRATPLRSLSSGLAPSATGSSRSATGTSGTRSGGASTRSPATRSG